jgi:hypothetical protein
LGGFFLAIARMMLWMKVRAQNIFPFVSTTCRARWVPSLLALSSVKQAIVLAAVERESIERTIAERLA